MISESGQHLSRGNSSQFNSQPVEIDSISDILFDSWSSGSDSSKSSCHRIPQVDGNMDASGTTDDYGENHNDNHSQTNLSSMIDGVNPVRKRRRLRLRLPHRQHTISRTIDGTQNRTIPGISSPISLSVPTSNHAYPSTNLCPDNISSPVIERKQDFTDKTFVEDSYTTVHSTPLARLDSKLKSRISTTLDDRYSNPVVILQRLPSSVLSSFSPTEPFCYQSGRLTPPEEFEDLSDTIVINSPQIDTSELNQSSSVNLFEQPIFSSFHHEISDFTCCCSPNTSDNIHPGRLSLYSQTQLSSPIGCNTDKHRVDQSHNGLPSTSLIASPPSIPFWRPIHSPPRLQVVNEWLQKLKASKDCKALNIFDTELNCIESQLDLSQTDEESPLHSNELFPQDTSDKMLNTSFQHSTAVHVPKSTEQNPVDVCSMNSSTGNEHLSTTGLSGVSSSVSVLYQAANERCYSSIQVDHTTVASLELHCRSRLTGSSGVIPTSTDFGVLAKSMKSSTTHSRCGLIPDPILDPIQVACLSFSHPRQVSSTTQTIEQQSRCTDLFILILQSDLPGASTIPLKQLQCKYFHGLTNFGYEKRRKHKSRHLTPRMIWCTTEWSLISWIVYLIHTFDPEILIGYDVERFSWGYLVERANHLGRRTFTRELSRLAADIINCPHCHECVDECIKMVHTTTGITSGQKSQWHFDTQEFMNNLDQPCNCPCNPLYTSTLASKHFNYHTNNNTKDTNNPRVVWPCGPGAGRTGGLFACPGRVVLCFWRILMHEISLYEYSLETVVHELLKEYMPRYTFGQLNEWYMNVDGINRWRTVDYWIRRSVVNLRLLNTLDLIGRTSEFARVFGIEFYHVLSRGSQYRVESLLCRIAKQSNFLLPSPSVTQRAYQRAPEGIPLNLEPESVLFIDGPVVVLDFQSLYPSIIIAYNYCYSTVLGRLSCLLQGENAVFNLGCLSHSLPSGLLKKIGQEVNISPNGVVFVKKSIREGILPRMLRQLIATRLMVKDSIKLYKSDKCLNRLLDTRQLGLKLMANVTFGYTAASFSGRMPCVDLGDSIVHKARETLENAIRLVNSGEIILPDSCSGLSTPRVVYGDTDSLFIHLKGYGKLEAFDAAYRIAEVITSNNPVPIKLKFEKIYYPCILEAKKRYAGYAYESLDQVIPVFDAKGIETVRRDSCPFVGRILEECFKYLFNHFTIPQCVNNNDVTTSSCHKATGYENLDQTLKLAEYNMRNKIQQFAYRLVHGRIPFHECIIARPYWGQSAYKPGTFAPALQVARRLLSLDPRSEPLRGERVVYYVTSGRSDQTLLSCVRSIHEIYPSIWIAGKSATSRRVLAPRLNFAYYLDKQFIPPIERMTQVIGWRVRTWLSDLPRFLTSKHHRYNLTIGPSYAPPSTSQRRFTNLGSPSSSLSLSPSSSLLNLASGIQRKRYRRASSLMRAFVGQPPLICPSCEFIVPKTSSTDQLGHCRTCINGNSRLMNIGVIKLGCAINCIQSHLNRLETVCTYCTIHHDMKCDPIWLCNNLNCPISSQRLLGSADLALLWTHYTKCLNHQMDTVSSW
ncbi:unnamed protein product [Heterobilharzia americana]|nr:unnamed protein product [Heterobilharzia americana]